MQETGIPGEALRLEVTETVAMRDIDYSVRILRELDTLGIYLALDDFGNGYSSLGYLKRFPLKVLKIDRSFIQDIGINKNGEAITSAIISIGHTLNLEVVAEGGRDRNSTCLPEKTVVQRSTGIFIQQAAIGRENKPVSQCRTISRGAGISGIQGGVRRLKQGGAVCNQ